MSSKDTKKSSLLKKIQTLEENEILYKQLFNQMRSGVAIYTVCCDGKDFIFKDINKASERIDKIKKSDVIGKKVTKVFPNVEKFGLLDVFKQVYKTGKPEKHPISLYKDKRITGWRENYVYKIPSGEIVAVYADISQQKKYEEKLRLSAELLEKILLESVEAFGVAIEKRDPYTSGHQKRTAKLAKAIAEKLNISKQKTQTIYLSALIHDIGKIYIPSAILNKPSPLTKSEYDLVKMHAKVGYEILSKIDFPWPIDKIILHHHERIDGSGYPSGLKNGKIIKEAQIIALADIVEAMLSNRPYRKALKKAEVFKKIESYKNEKFSPEIIDACLELFKKDKFKF